MIEKMVDSQKISPALPKDIKNFLIDIDGTIYVKISLMKN